MGTSLYNTTFPVSCSVCQLLLIWVHCHYPYAALDPQQSTLYLHSFMVGPKNFQRWVTTSTTIELRSSIKCSPLVSFVCLYTHSTGGLLGCIEITPSTPQQTRAEYETKWSTRLASLHVQYFASVCNPYKWLLHKLWNTCHCVQAHAKHFAIWRLQGGWFHLINNAFLLQFVQ